MAQAPLIDHNGANVELNMAPAIAPFQASNYSAPASNTAAVVTADADNARPNTIRQIICSYSAAPTGGYVQVEDGSGTVVWKMYITGGGEHIFNFEMPKTGTANNAMIVTLAAGGVGITGTLYADIYRHS